MNTSEKKRNISIEYKALVVLSIMLLFLAALVPLWQIGVNRSLEIASQNQKESILRLAEEERIMESKTLKAGIDSTYSISIR